MPELKERSTTTDVSSIRAMRYAGATLEQIAAKIGRTKERVRQILLNNCGSTGHKLLSTRQLCHLSGLSRKQVVRLAERGVITPVREWSSGHGRYAVWSRHALEQIEGCTEEPAPVRLCRICHKPVPANRSCYCSTHCYKESHKYKYRSAEARQRHLLTMRRYKESCKQLTAEASPGQA